MECCRTTSILNGPNKFIQLLPPANVVCEGYVFTPVCQSFCSQGGSTLAGTPPDQYTPQTRYNPRPGTPPTRYTPQTRYNPPGQGTPPRTREIWVTSGWYASYWNVFLFSVIFNIHPISFRIKLQKKFKMHTTKFNRFLRLLATTKFCDKLLASKIYLVISADNKTCKQMILQTDNFPECFQSVVEDWHGRCSGSDFTHCKTDDSLRQITGDELSLLE